MDRRDVLAVGGFAAAAAMMIAGRTEAAETSLDRSAEAVRQFAATLTAHDMDAFARLFADDYINHQISAAAPPPNPGLSPKQASVGFFAARLKGMPDLSVTVEASIITADMVSASFVYTGTHLGPYFGVAPTGRHLRFTSCDIFRLRDGQFVEHWGMGDIAGVLAQLKG